MHCEYWFEHEPETTCEHCGLAVDKYGNTEEDFPHCCFPDCGCDGARNCMAQEPNMSAVVLNREPYGSNRDD